MHGPGVDERAPRTGVQPAGNTEKERGGEAAHRVGGDLRQHPLQHRVADAAQPGVEAGGRFLHLYLFRPQAPTRAASGEIGGEIHAAGFDLQLAVYAADRLMGGEFQRPFHFGDAADRRGGLFGIGQPQQHGAGERPEFRLAGQPPREQFG